jgi:hypothetical protein
MKRFVDVVTGLKFPGGFRHSSETNEEILAEYIDNCRIVARTIERIGGIDDETNSPGCGGVSVLIYN